MPYFSRTWGFNPTASSEPDGSLCFLETVMYSSSLPAWFIACRHEPVSCHQIVCLSSQYNLNWLLENVHLFPTKLQDKIYFQLLYLLFFLFYKIRSQILLVFMKSVVSPGLRSTLIYMRLSTCSLCDQHKFRREILAAAREQSKMWKMTGEGEAAEQHSSRRDRKQGGAKDFWKLVLRCLPRAPHHSDLTWLLAVLVTLTLTAFGFGIPVLNWGWRQRQLYLIVMTINIWCIQILRRAAQEVHKENDKSALSSILKQGAGNKRKTILTERFPLENRIGDYKSKSIITNTEKDTALHTRIVPQCLIIVSLFFNCMACFRQNMHLYFHGFNKI